VKSLRALVLTVALAAATTAGAQGTSPAKKPAKEPPVKDLTCEAYLALPEGSRSVLVGWVAGQGYRKGAFAPWALDAERSGKLLAHLAEECGKTPGASFWYKAKEELRHAK